MQWWFTLIGGKNKEVVYEHVKKNLFRIIDLKAEFLPSIYHPLWIKYLKTIQLKRRTGQWNFYLFINGRIKTDIGKDNMLFQTHSFLTCHMLIYTIWKLTGIRRKRNMYVIDLRKWRIRKLMCWMLNIYNDLLNIHLEVVRKLFIHSNGLKIENWFKKI